MARNVEDVPAERITPLIPAQGVARSTQQSRDKFTSMIADSAASFAGSLVSLYEILVQN